jgi:hypothetical protein
MTRSLIAGVDIGKSRCRVDVATDTDGTIISWALLANRTDLPHETLVHRYG